MKINESNAERVEGGKEEKKKVVIRLEERERVGRMRKENVYSQRNIKKKKKTWSVDAGQMAKGGMNVEAS